MAKVVKGGRRFSFTALVVVGDEVDQVGIGYGKASEVPVAISKAVDDAKKNLFRVPKHGTTIPHEILGGFGAGRVMLSRRAGNRRDRRRRRARRAGARRHPRHPGEVARHVEPDQPLPATETACSNLRRPEDVAKLRGKRSSTSCRARRRRAEEPRAGASRRRGRSRSPRSRAGERLTQVKVTQVRSQIGQTRHRGTLRALARPDRQTASTRRRRSSPGAHQVGYLVKVEKVDES